MFPRRRRAEDDVPLQVMLYRRFTEHMAIQKLVLDPALSLTQREQHACSVSCPIFEWCDRFVCCVTGQVHHCTPETCFWFRIDEDSRFCPASKKRWPLEAEDNMDMGALFAISLNGSVDKFHELESKGSRKRKRGEEPVDVTPEPIGPDLFADVPQPHKQTDAELEDVAYQILRKLCLSRERRLLDIGNHRTTKKRVGSAFRLYVTYQNANGFKLELLSMVCLYLTANRRQSRCHPQFAKGMPIPNFIREPVTEEAPAIREKLRGHAKQCVKYWRLLSPIVLPDKKKVRYRFPFHCLGYLYTLRKGAGNLQHTLLEADSSLDALLPNVSHLNEMHLTQKVFTQHKEEFLKRLIAHYVAEQSKVQ